jgi:hypothetical protein
MEQIVLQNGQGVKYISPPMNAPLSVAERKRAERTRMRALGLVLRQFWVHPKDWPRVQRYLERISRRRTQ